MFMGTQTECQCEYDVFHVRNWDSESNRYSKRNIISEHNDSKIAVFYLFAFTSFAFEFTLSFRFGDKTTTYSSDRTSIFDIHNFAMTARIEVRIE